MKLRLVAAIVGVLSVTLGCGTGVRIYQDGETTPIQGTRPLPRDTLPVEALLQTASPVAVEFGVSGAMLDEGGMASPALLYEIPPLDKVHVLTLGSKPRYDVRDLGLVYPRVRLLDAQRVPTREFAWNRFVYREDLRVTIFFDPARRQERFVLITADAVPADRLQRVPSRPGATPHEHASFNRGVLVLDFRPEPVEHVPFP